MAPGAGISRGAGMRPFDPAALLDRPEVRAHDPARVETLLGLLGRPAEAGRGGRRLVERLPHGSVAFFLPDAPAGAPLRLLEFDRHGRLTLAIHRDHRGRLERIWLLDPSGRPIGVERGVGAHPLWGRSDQVCRLAPGAPFEVREVLTLFQSVDWEAIAAIPPLAEPGRLPAGAGSALLNLLACLLQDQGRTVVRYRGPYPTEQLFLALLEAFRYDPGVPDPLGRFLAGAEAMALSGQSREAPLDWTPAPHERLFPAPGVYVQLRDGVEKVVVDGRSYYRPRWQGVFRREHRTVRAVGEGTTARYAASLVAMETVLEDHLILDAEGEILARPEPHTVEAPRAPLTGAWGRPLLETVVRESTPLLETAIREVFPRLRLAWGPVKGDLVEAEREAVTLNPALAAVYRARLRTLTDPGERLALAARLFGEVANLIAPMVRLAAQRWLEGLPPAEREETFTPQPQAPEPDRALPALLAALADGRELPS